MSLVPAKLIEKVWGLAGAGVLIADAESLGEQGAFASAIIGPGELFSSPTFSVDNGDSDVSKITLSPTGRLDTALEMLLVVLDNEVVLLLSLSLRKYASILA